MIKYLFILVLMPAWHLNILMSSESGITETKASEFTKLKIINSPVAKGYRESTEKRIIDVIVIHSTYNKLDSDSFSVKGVLKQFKKYNVAVHYLIDREGLAYQLVDEKHIAFHAGKSKLPDGRKDVNLYSIGIELINTRHKGPNDFQYQTLSLLVKHLKKRYKILYILGHCDIAPKRKTDPWKFDWKKFNKILNCDLDESQDVSN